MKSSPPAGSPAGGSFPPEAMLMLNKLSRAKLGQTTVEYILVVACIALPLSLVFFRWTQQFLAGVLVEIVNQFSGYS